MEFLKKIYPAIWQIDDWHYIYRKIGEKIKVDKNKGYTDLWMKSRTGIGDCLAGYRDIQVKKVIKGLCNNWLCQK